MSSVLGDRSPASFLRDYWQKRPLLIRQALPGFSGILDRDTLLGLAARADATSRLVLEHPRGRRRWERHDGPFAGLDAAELPASHWTLLVHGVEGLVPGGWELLGRFSFIPAARVDDLMVSYAAHAGSVGPHDDLYDVFLLQGPGRRRWQVATGGDRTLDTTAAIKVLASFVPDEEWVLEPGDMLYLPPGVAHWGVAEGPCFTYSIGLIAPGHKELVESFLGYLAHALAPAIDPDALVEDAGLRRQKNPLEVNTRLVEEVASILGVIRWDQELVGDFLGAFLTRPKPRVQFTPPARPLSADAFARRLGGRGRLALALPSRGLSRRGRLYLNGEAHRAGRATLRLFEELASARSLALPLSLDDHALELFYAWYGAGYLQIAGGRRARSR
jgi:50S ribosomal protein L16 3-hydroxylase